MKRLAVFSGKGGTGKTTLLATFATIIEEVVAVDCDVDAANLALLLRGEDAPPHLFFSGEEAEVNEEACIGCGACIPTCRFDALHWAQGADRVVRVDPLSCEGCHACEIVCPVDAFDFKRNQAGSWSHRPLDGGADSRRWLVHASLGVAQDNSGKLVSEVRSEADRLAQEHGIDTVLIDGPPGVGCAVHAAIGQVDRILVVTEPTPSGAHDLLRLLDTAAQFNVAACVAINKYDLSEKGAARIVSASASRGVEVIGKIPFDPGIPRALARGRLPLGEAVEPATDQAIRQLWERFRDDSSGRAIRRPTRISMGG